MRGYRRLGAMVRPCCAIAACDSFSDRYSRRISAQSSTVITLQSKGEVLTFQPELPAHFSTGADRHGAHDEVDDARQACGVAADLGPGSRRCARIDQVATAPPAWHRLPSTLNHPGFDPRQTWGGSRFSYRCRFHSTAGSWPDGTVEPAQFGESLLSGDRPS